MSNLCFIKSLTIAMIVVLISAPAPNLYATPALSADKKLEIALENYLDADCGTPPTDPEARKKPFGALRTLLVLKHPDAEARLLEILRRGLGAKPGNLSHLKLRLEKEWEEKVKNSPPGDIAGGGHGVNKEVYVQQNLAWRDEANRQKAAVALVLIDTPNARAALREAGLTNAALARSIARARVRYGIENRVGVDEITIGP